MDKLKQKVKDAELEKEEFEELISAQKKEIKELSVKVCCFEFSSRVLGGANS